MYQKNSVLFPWSAILKRLFGDPTQENQIWSWKKQRLKSGWQGKRWMSQVTWNQMTILWAFWIYPFFQKNNDLYYKETEAILKTISVMDNIDLLSLYIYIYIYICMHSFKDSTDCQILSCCGSVSLETILILPKNFLNFWFDVVEHYKS